MKEGFAFAGANAFRTTSIVSVKETIQSLIREFSESIGQAAGTKATQTPTA